jgi:hypothetical protein
MCAAQALAEKGVPYTSKYTDLFNGQSLSPEYLAVNPKGTVPALVIQQGPDRRVIADSRCARCRSQSHLCLVTKFVCRHITCSDLGHEAVARCEGPGRLLCLQTPNALYVLAWVYSVGRQAHNAQAAGLTHAPTPCQRGYQGRPGQPC